jgi:hypothetical protein
MKYLMKSPVALLVLMSCQTDSTFGGTAVGNPTGMDMSVGAPKGGVVTWLALPGAEILARGCDGTEARLMIPRAVSLMEHEQYQLPPGPLCEIQILPAGPISVLISGADHTATLLLNLPPLRFQMSGLEQPPAILLELGHAGWFDVEEIGLLLGNVQVRPGDPRHDALLSAMIRTTAIYPDLNGDGLIQDGEGIALAGAEQMSAEESGDTALDTILDTGSGADGEDDGENHDHETGRDTGSDTASSARKPKSKDSDTGDNDNGQGNDGD